MLVPLPRLQTFSLRDHSFEPAKKALFSSILTTKTVGEIVYFKRAFKKGKKMRTTKKIFCRAAQTTGL